MFLGLLSTSFYGLEIARDRYQVARIVGFRVPRPKGAVGQAS